MDDLLRKDPALAEIVRRLVDALEPERIYLSSARKGRGHRQRLRPQVLVPDQTAVDQDTIVARLPRAARP